jgi:hypothetical protein
MTFKLIPVGKLKVWSDPKTNVLAGPGVISDRSLSLFKRVRWDGDGMDLETHIGMGGFMRGPEIANVDVRVAFRDARGVVLFLDYTSRVCLPTHVAGKTPAYLTGRVDMDEKVEKYAWLTRTQLIGKGMFDTAEHALVYEMFALE